MTELDDIQAIQARLMGWVPREKERSLAAEVDWGARLVGIVGARGTGKTTLLLQHLSGLDWQGGEALYLSADHVIVEGTGLYEVVSMFFQRGGRIAVVDEVHKRSTWAREIKSLHDSYPSNRLVISGSSMLAVKRGGADLSRRAVFHTLPCLSFREFVGFTEDRQIPAVDLGTLVVDHPRICAGVIAQGPILGSFQRYLRHGAYPFVLEGEGTYHRRLHDVVDKVLYEDIPAVTNMRPGGVAVCKRILWAVASTPPWELNIERLSRNVGATKQTVYDYLDHLEQAGLLAGIMPAASGNALVRKPAKLFLENTNLLAAVGRGIGSDGSMGTVRETFLANQLRAAGHDVRASKRGDFVVDSRHTVEVGGRSKSRRQPRGVPEGIVARDDVEVGSDRTIPLWAFGLLY